MWSRRHSHHWYMYVLQITWNIIITSFKPFPGPRLFTLEYWKRDFLSKWYLVLRRPSFFNPIKRYLVDLHQRNDISSGKRCLITKRPKVFYLFKWYLVDNSQTFFLQMITCLFFIILALLSSEKDRWTVSEIVWPMKASQDQPGYVG